MRTGVERLRAGLLVGAAVVAAVVAGFLLLARWRAHRLLGDLPARLGLEIEKETNGFTTSKSVGGRTVFTIHAATATQRKDGQALLHEVGIVLYGKDGRADRIHGKDFDYDQKTGVVRAKGQVELDLQAPAPTTARDRAAYARGGPAPRAGATGQGGAVGEREPVHVVTTGLVYVQKLGVASTDGPLAFTFRGVRGEAVGAAYNTDTGVTVLERAVRMRLMEAGRPAELQATHAEMDQQHHRISLQGARYVTSMAGAEGRPAEQRAVAAERMEVQMNEGGDVEQASGSGGVVITAGAAEARSPEGLLTMSDEGRPARLVLRGGVVMSRGNGGETARATEAVLLFDAAGAARQAQMKGAVAVERVGEGGGKDRLDAGEAVLQMKGGARQRTILERVDATGGARLMQSGGNAMTQEVDGDRLVAVFGEGAAGRTELREVTGAGQTRVRRVADGFEEESRGETLEARFGVLAAVAHGPAAAKGKASGLGVVSAVQKGGVVVDRRPVPGGATGVKGGAGGGATHGRAAELVYDGVAGRETLQGGAEIEDEEGAVRATEIVVTQLSGDAVATGDVLVTYAQTPAAGAPGGKATGAPPEPVHVASARAEVRRSAGEAEFFGGAGGRGVARMWQGGSQVEAPVLLLRKAGGVLEARGGDRADGMPVRTLLAQSGEAKGDARGEKAGAAAGAAGTRASAAVANQGSVMRVASGSLRFSNETHEAVFGGGVRMEDGVTTMESRTATAVLAGAKTPGAAGTAPGETASAAMLGGHVERVVATDDVVIRQPPGRTATGAKAVYTASDGMVVMTGTAAVPPRAEDPLNGTVTGASLRFRAGDNSVMVEGRSREGEQSTGDGKVHVQTRVRRP